MKGRDFALLTDLYELTMMQGYYETGAYNRKVVFDLFYSCLLYTSINGLTSIPR